MQREQLREEEPSEQRAKHARRKQERRTRRYPAVSVRRNAAARTIMWTCGWWVIAEPHVWRTAVLAAGRVVQLGVPEQYLDDPDVGAVLQQVGRHIRRAGRLPAAMPLLWRAHDHHRNRLNAGGSHAGRPIQPPRTGRKLHDPAWHGRSFSRRRPTSGNRPTRVHGDYRNRQGRNEPRAGSAKPRRGTTKRPLRVHPHASSGGRAIADIDRSSKSA